MATRLPLETQTLRAELLEHLLGVEAGRALGLLPAAWQAKASKDLAQAGEVIATLLEDRPGDLGLAWRSLTGRGSQWKKAAERGIAAFARHAPSLGKALKAAL
jgi:hypothetical protein